MAWQSAGYDGNGNTIYKDTATGICYYKDEYGQYTIAGACPFGGNVATSSPSGIKVTGQVGGIGVSSGQTTLDKILATITSLAAIGKGAQYVPTTTHPAQPNITFPEPIVAGAYQPQATAGGQFGDSIQRFVTENTGLLLLGGIALVLWRSGRR